MAHVFARLWLKPSRCGAQGHWSPEARRPRPVRRGGHKRGATGRLWSLVLALLPPGAAAALTRFTSGLWQRVGPSGLTLETWKGLFAFRNRFEQLSGTAASLNLSTGSDKGWQLEACALDQAGGCSGN